MTSINKGFIVEHAKKEALEMIQIEMYIFICKLFMEELERINQRDQISF